jgi:hypothetical protein
VKVQQNIPAAVIVGRRRVVVAVPEPVELLAGPRLAAVDGANEVVARRAAVALETLGRDAERADDQLLLLVEDLGEVGERPAVEGRCICMHVETAVRVTATPCELADRPHHVLQLPEVGICEDGSHDLSPQVGRH